MPEQAKTFCPDCEHGPGGLTDLDRRTFLQAVGGQVAATALAAGVLGRARAAETPAAAKPSRPAEDLIKELFAGLTAEQKKEVVLPYNHGAEGGKLPTRMGMYNAPIGGKKIGEKYSAAQQELVERILRSISSDEAGYRCITRNNTFDNSGSIKNCGALLFGEPVDGQDWSWVFTGHHLTVRCDGKTHDGVGFGGPMYYGHSPNGYSEKNVFFYQTKGVLRVFDALDEKQRKAAVVRGTPGEQYPSVKFRPAGEPHPGLMCSELSQDQKGLIEKVMHDILSPFRKEDGDEVMAVVKAIGLDKIHLAFYQQGEVKDNQPWHFWRLEGPGFVWNFRVLPHVHTFVNIAGKV